MAKNWDFRAKGQELGLSVRAKRKGYGLTTGGLSARAKPPWAEARGLKADGPRKGSGAK